MGMAHRQPHIAGRAEFAIHELARQQVHRR